jgi:hypothetical protein
MKYSLFWGTASVEIATHPYYMANRSAAKQHRPVSHWMLTGRELPFIQTGKMTVWTDRVL